MQTGEGKICGAAHKPARLGDVDKKEKFEGKNGTGDLHFHWSEGSHVVNG